VDLPYNFDGVGDRVGPYYAVRFQDILVPPPYDIDQNRVVDFPYVGRITVIHAVDTQTVAVFDLHTINGHKHRFRLAPRKSQQNEQ
ncbi:MAG TPA: hypothetical protein DEB12_02630, partial [Porphyromonadaceae bacterium]|nr:hypothetical protein [Porphyromonadaceae bacterium]